jgi:hypothetical protein
MRTAAGNLGTDLRLSPNYVRVIRGLPNQQDLQIRQVGLCRARHNKVTSRFEKI